MTGRQRLAVFSLAVSLAAIGGLIMPRSATAINGCFTFKNSEPQGIPDADAPGGMSYYCAGSATTSCEDCLTDIDEGDGGPGQNECVSGPFDTYCEQYY
jgi:hypothetical protein